MAAQPDTVALKEVEVLSGAPTAAPRVYRDGSLNFNSNSLEMMPRVLGEADPLNYIKLLPGINTISDYSAGVTIDGMNYANNLYTLAGVPVHFPYHFGGVFSTFNTSVYPDTKVLKSIRGASAPDYIGGIVAVNPARTMPGRLKAKLNLGMTASTIDATVPVGQKFTIAAAARLSYLNLFYGSLLGGEDTRIRYSFYDTDVLARWDIDSANTVEGSFHYNSDRLSYDDNAFVMLTSMHWHNTLGGIRWHSRHSRYDMSHHFYHSAFANTLGVDLPQLGLSARAAFAQTGLEGCINTSPGKGFRLTAAYAAHRYAYSPQSIGSYGLSDITHVPARHLHATLYEASADLRYRHAIIELSAGAKASYFHGKDSYHTLGADPYVSVLLDRGRWSASLYAGSGRQYVHQVGLSEIGMSSNFKLCADADAPPEKAWTLAANGTYSPWRWLNLSADVYYKKVFNQAEYSSTVLELTSPGYQAEDYISVYDGFNTGFNIMAALTLKAVNASASYSFCHARRRDPATGSMFTAITEIRHSANAMASWHINRHWDVSATFTLASGRPYTPITAIYMIGERVMMEYGDRNSARMPLYHRLDLGGAYLFSTGGRLPLKHRIDLSILNAYNHKNIEISTFTYESGKHRFRRRDIGSLYRMLPSLSYTITF